MRLKSYFPIHHGRENHSRFQLILRENHTISMSFAQTPLNVKRIRIKNSKPERRCQSASLPVDVVCMMAFHSPALCDWLCNRHCGGRWKAWWLGVNLVYVGEKRIADNCLIRGHHTMPILLIRDPILRRFCASSLFLLYSALIRYGG